jgi:hypothetical protein
MNVFSAADAIAPAISRTNRFLFHPFRLGTFLKLSLVAVITEGMSGNLNSSHYSPTTHGVAPGTMPPLNFPGGWLGLALLVIAITIPIAIAIFYLITRLRFAYFHCLVYQVKQIAPGWRLYREQAMRFFLLSIGVGFGFLAVVVLCALPFVSGFIKFFRDMHQGGHFDLGGFLALFLPLLLLLVVLGLLGWATDVILRDMMMPHMALENATVGEAWGSVSARIGAEPGAFFLYGFLRLVLPIVAFIAIAILLAIPVLVIAVGMGAAVAGLTALVVNAAGFAKVLLLTIEAVIILLGIGISLFVGLFVGGPVATAIRSYALVFYGSRYQLLGDLLYPPAPPQVAPGTVGAPSGS